MAAPHPPPPPKKKSQMLLVCLIKCLVLQLLLLGVSNFLKIGNFPTSTWRKKCVANAIKYCLCGFD